MLLRIAGINHFDPLGREKLQGWFHQYGKREAEPSFVATEWDENIFARVREQRRRFRALAAERWPLFSDELLDTLAMSLGYEADSHTQFFPNAEVLWLDQGRRANEQDLNAYAEDRIQLYAAFLEGINEVLDSRQTLTAMSRAADERAAGQAEVDERDQRFARLILDRADDKRWAFVIVGRHHAVDREGSMRRLLEEVHQRCEVAFLCG